MKRYLTAFMILLCLSGALGAGKLRFVKVGRDAGELKQKNATKAAAAASNAELDEYKEKKIQENDTNDRKKTGKTLEEMRWISSRIEYDLEHVKSKNGNAEMRKMFASLQMNS
ncbi:unnamed protein product [Hermetia illucens]|uniref:Uncharacterized protein n=1 Tax=Hermetia illucens TaxID=343691 RepID=A0A7R8V2G2_HERIL|nr:unnamed protein product [Hermetia illucens]